VVLGYHTRWPPPGCRALPITLRLLRRTRDLHRNIRPELLRMAGDPAFRDRVVFLRSPAAMRDYRHRLTRGLGEQVGGVGDGGRS